MDRIQLRRDTSARWAEINPILLEGEVGYEIDTKLRKIGDGVSRWNDLEYLKAEGISQETGNSQNITMSQDAITKELSKLSSEVIETSIKADYTFDGKTFFDGGLNTNNKWYNNVGTINSCLFIPIEVGDEIHIELGNYRLFYYAFLSNFSKPVANEAIPIIGDGVLTSSNEVNTEAPAGAKYLVVNRFLNGNDMLPSVLKINGHDVIKGVLGEIKGVLGEIEDIKDDIEEIDTKIVELKRKPYFSSPEVDDYIKEIYINGLSEDSIYYLRVGLSNDKYIVQILDETKTTQIAGGIYEGSPYVSISTRVSGIGIFGFAIFNIEKVKSLNKMSSIVQVNNTVFDLSYSPNIWDYINNNNKLDLIFCSFNMLPLDNIPKINGAINTNNYWFVSDSSENKSIFIPIKEGDVIETTANLSSTSYYAFLTSFDKSEYTNGEKIKVVDGTSVQIYAAGTSIVTEAPAGAKYLVINYIVNNLVRTPSVLKINGRDIIKGVLGEIEDIKDDIEDIKEKENITTIIVKKDGTGHYTSFVNAIDKASSIVGDKIIYIYPGIYDVIEELGGEEFIAGYTSGRGVEIPDNTSIIGVGNRNDIIIKGELPNTVTNNMIQNISTLNIRGNCSFKGISITARNMRYVVHDESGGAVKDYIHTFEDCYIEHYGNYNTAWLSQWAIGAGSSSGGKVIIKDCILIGYTRGGFTNHTNFNFEKPNIFHFENSYFGSSQSNDIHGLRLSTYGNWTIKNKAYINNCIMQGLRVEEEQEGYGNSWEVVGGGNSPCSLWLRNTVGDFAIPLFSDEVKLCRAAVKITKFAPVTIKDNLAYIAENSIMCDGIALNDAEIGDKMNVKIKGFIPYDWTELSPIIGDKIGVELGKLIISTTDYIAIAKDTANGSTGKGFYLV